MSASDPRHSDDGNTNGSDGWNGAGAEPERRGALELLTDDGEKWTAIPETAADRERLTRWITVDAAALRDLEEWR